MDTSTTTIERTVIQLRKRFDDLVKRCGGHDRLSKRLEPIDPYFGTIQGYEVIRNAKRGKAGEVAMTRIVNAMEQLAKKSKKTPAKDVKDSLSRMGVYVPKYDKTRELQSKMQKTKKAS